MEAHREGEASLLFSDERRITVRVRRHLGYLSNRAHLVTSCAIITTEANELVGELHDRMPAILLNEFQDAWLDPRIDCTVLTEMLKPFPSLMMKTYPVSNRVNSPDNNPADPKSLLTSKRSMKPVVCDYTLTD